MPTQEEWEAAIRDNYRRSVQTEEYENKCATNPDAVRKIAYYFKETDYDQGMVMTRTITEETEALADMIMLLFDFQNFTEGV